MATLSNWHELSTGLIVPPSTLFIALSAADRGHLPRDNSTVAPSAARTGRYEGALSVEPHSSPVHSSSTRHDTDISGHLPLVATRQGVGSVITGRRGRCMMHREHLRRVKQPARHAPITASPTGRSMSTLTSEPAVRGGNGSNRQSRPTWHRYLPPPAYPKYGHTRDGRNAAVRRAGSCPRWSAGNQGGRVKSGQWIVDRVAASGPPPGLATGGQHPRTFGFADEAGGER